MRSRWGSGALEGLTEWYMNTGALGITPPPREASTVVGGCGRRTVGRTDPRTERAARRGLMSVRPRTAQDSASGAPEDHQVQGEGPVLHVAHVQLHGLVPAQVRATADLPQAGDPGLDEEPAVHVRPVLLDLPVDVRPRPDERHLALEDVDELRELVERVPAEEAAHGGDARVLVQLELHGVALVERHEGIEIGRASCRERV